MKKESDDQRRAWEDIKKAHTFAELMKALPIQLLERCAEIILSFWILSPLFILIRSAVLSGDDLFQHLATRYPQHITGDRTQLDVGIFQHFLNPVDLTRPILNQLGAITY